MPTLEWIGKKAVLNHHNEIPFRLLKCNPELSVGDPGSGNLLVQGDNLEALKALLPYYAGKVKCIYIDPPYNTGNEGWKYNDAVNSPEMRTWLRDAVGRETEDLARHDKWLCMMYPRLQLLKQFLCSEGLIFVSIDDNEASSLKHVLDEIFEPFNFVQQIIWKNKYGPGAGTKGFGNVHEYIFCYSRNPIESIVSILSEEEIKKYKLRDSKYPQRGGYMTQPLATRSKDDRPNLVYPVVYNGEEIWPDKQWIWAKERLLAAIKNDEVIFRKSKGKWSVRFKQYLKDENGRIRSAKPISILNGPFNQEGTWEIEKIFGSKVFSNPKPRPLIEYLLSMVVNGSEQNNTLILDSFAGSGTTAHAVLSLNKNDSGRRRFVIVEMNGEIATKITHARLKRAVLGYSWRDNKGNEQNEKPLGGGFRYCELGPTLFDADGKIRSEVSFQELAQHVFFSETGEPLPPKKRQRSPLLGVSKNMAIYLLYNGILQDKSPGGGNVLTNRTMSLLPQHKGPRIIYGTACRLSRRRLGAENILFRQIPYQVKVR